MTDLVVITIKIHRKDRNKLVNDKAQFRGSWAALIEEVNRRLLVTEPMKIRIRGERSIIRSQTRSS